MDIKCIHHLSKAAKGLCQECSFLCDLHDKEEYNKYHIFINMNKPIANLYDSITIERKATIACLSIEMLKEVVDGLISHEMNINAAQRQQASITIAMCKKANIGL